MQGLMMDRPLAIAAIGEFAERYYGSTEIVSVTADNPLHRYTYRDCFRRARQLGDVLTQRGYDPATRIATIAWNDYRHMECYYGISGVGLVCHTINPRLFPEQLVYIVNHADDKLLFTDPMFLPLIEKLKDKLPSLETVVVFTDEANMPETSLADVVSYETFIADGDPEFAWPEFDERSASALCYTSGTTGNPKGVLYSHRSTLLHAMVGNSDAVLPLSPRDTVLPVVPMFHVNAWGIPYSAPMVGAKIVYPGPKMGDGEALWRLMEDEDVTMSAGVPTVWLALLAYVRNNNKTFSTLQRTLVGGAAVPAAVIAEFRDRHGIDVQQGWGMTETSPIGSVNKVLPKFDGLSPDEMLELRTKAGRAVFGVEMKIVDDAGNEQPWDGSSSGALRVRGPWVCSAYFGIDGVSEAHEDAGWFDTGDVATIDPDGYMAITDRTKDVIKSGGEWISSIDLENAAVGHPGVAEAAVIGVSHPKWTERPLLIVVTDGGDAPSKTDILGFLDGKVAKWWLPDDVVFVDEIPHTATGKILKTELRKQFADYVLPTA
ncbi:MAG: long-chain-fatty-acid--CoA ligase [Pseudomonadota bacterium]